MRGLLGDATEEFIESLDKKEGEASNDEEIYKRAKVCGFFYCSLYNSPVSLSCLYRESGQEGG